MDPSHLWSCLSGRAEVKHSPDESYYGMATNHSAEVGTPRNEREGGRLEVKREAFGRSRGGMPPG